jgi:ankyrin repeat protein
LTYIGVRERDMERETLIAEEETGVDLTEMRRAASSGALKLLLAAGADVNARDNDGRTITHFIARDAGDYFDPDGMIRLLIKAGADANARDREGVTPLMLAADIDECPALEVIAALAEGGAKFDAKDKHERSVRSRIGQSRFKWGRWKERFTKNSPP